MHPTSLKSRVWASQIQDALTSAQSGTYRLSETIVDGKLDLKNSKIKCGIEIIDCHFRDEVDIASCEFEQLVNLSKTTFDKAFVGGGLRTVYKNGLICENAHFKGGATFSHVSCEGNASFKAAIFGEENDRSKADHGKVALFESAMFGTALDCEEAIFWIGANFKSVQSKGRGNFCKAAFKNQETGVTFEFASFGTIFSCSEAIFWQEVNCEGLKCGGHGFFESARFEHEKADVSFRAASFGGTLNCGKTRFKGPVNFNGFECRYGSFQSARFRNKDARVDFTYASFAIGIDCDFASFRGPTTFNSLQCGGMAHFKRTQFWHRESPATFRAWSIARAMNFPRSCFWGSADFRGVTCKAVANFGKCKFNGSEPADFSFSSFGLNVDFSDTHFAAGVILKSTEVASTLTLKDTIFEKSIDLNKAQIGSLKIEAYRPFPKGGVDFRDSQIGVFDFPAQTWEEMRDCQDPQKFTRDPYLQLEAYYKKIGNEYAARKVYLAGRNALRERAKAKGNNVHWTTGNWVNDSILKWLTGYGVETWRLMIVIGLLLALSIPIFWSADSLKAKPQATKAAPANSPQPSPQPSPEQPAKPTRLERLVYPLEIFVPVVKLDVADNWQPIPDWRRIYSIFYRICGWLLIPLLVASIAGVLKRE
jgi:hypothetical protein